MELQSIFKYGEHEKSNYDSLEYTKIFLNFDCQPKCPWITPKWDCRMDICMYELQSKILISVQNWIYVAIDVA